MKQLEIDGLKFETEDETVELLKVAVDGDGDKRIVGYKMMGGVIIKACSWAIEGTPMNGTYSKLIPIDKFKELKQAFKEGAIIECRSDYYNNDWVIIPKPSWNKIIDYRIKGDITISKWKVHKEVIKAFWDGSEIQYKCGKRWSLSTTPTWNTTFEYRIEPTVKELSVAEISTLLGYEVKVVK